MTPASATAAVGTVRRTVSRPASAHPRIGAAQVTEVQRTRMLAAAVQVVGELGFEKMSVARVTARAGVSRRTFYDLFEDREECFLAAFEGAVDRARLLVCAAAASGRDRRDWRGRVRAGLGALLVFFDEEPAAARVLVVDALKAGPVVLERRDVIVGELIGVVDAGRGARRGGRGVAPLTAEGVVGAVFAIVHARLQGKSRGGLTELLNPLMATIVLPYLGAAAAEKELARPVQPASRTRATSRRGRSSVDPLRGLDMRLTYRTLRVLGVLAGAPGASNRRVADEAGVSDQGQISKLLARLEHLGLVRNTGLGHVKGEANAWQLTARGRQVQQVVRGDSAGIDNEEE